MDEVTNRIVSGMADTIAYYEPSANPLTTLVRKLADPERRVKQALEELLELESKA